MGGMKQCLRRDATNVQTGTTKGSTFLDASGLEAELRGLDSGNVTTRATANNDDVVVIVSRSRSRGEGAGEDPRINGGGGWGRRK